MASVIVRLSANPWPFSAGIRLLTWDAHSHSDILLDDGMYIGAIPFPGVCAHRLVEPTEDFYAVEVTEAQKAAVVQFVRDQVGKSYDFGAIASFLTHRNWAEDDKWFCSELVAAAFHHAGVPLFNGTESRITPRDLAYHAKFAKVPKPDHAPSK